MIILRKYLEEQKEFSILSEISRLGLKKGTKNYIRKRKRDIVNKLIQNKREFLAKTKKTERKLTNLRKETKENELIADNLKKEANKVNADIIPNNKFSKLILKETNPIFSIKKRKIYSRKCLMIKVWIKLVENWPNQVRPKMQL